MDSESWCTGKTQRDGIGREAGGGIGTGNRCKSMADLCQCMTNRPYYIIHTLFYVQYSVLFDFLQAHRLQHTRRLFFLVLHNLPVFAQTHVHLVDDVIQPFHSLSPPSPPVLNLSQYQGLFQRVGSSH